MSCLFPKIIKVPPTNKLVTVSCRHCHNCRLEKQSELEFGCLLSLLQGYKNGTGASFITLTYSNKYLPLVVHENKPYGTLRKDHLNKWWARVRKVFRDNGLYVPQFVACGEYGENNTTRPHYHVLIFGCNNVQFQKIALDCWSYKKDLMGLVDCRPLRQGAIRYVIDYIMKENNTFYKSEYDQKGLERPFLRHSTRLGLEYLWNDFEYNAEDFTYLRNGKKVIIPAFYRKKLPGGAQFQYENVQAIVDSYNEGIPLDLYQLRNSFDNAELDVFRKRQKGTPAEQLPALTNYITSGVSHYIKEKQECEKVRNEFEKLGLPLERSFYTFEKLQNIDNETRKIIISWLKYLD